MVTSLSYQSWWSIEIYDDRACNNTSQRYFSYKETTARPKDNCGLEKTPRTMTLRGQNSDQYNDLKYFRNFLRCSLGASFHVDAGLMTPVCSPSSLTTIVAWGSSCLDGHLFHTDPIGHLFCWSSNSGETFVNNNIWSEATHSHELIIAE